MINDEESTELTVPCLWQQWGQHSSRCITSQPPSAKSQISNCKNPKAPVVTLKANFAKSRYLEMLLNHSK